MHLRRPARPARRAPVTPCHDEQETHQLGGRRGLDRAAELLEGRAVDAREQAAVAPFGLLRSDARAEAAAEDGAVELEAREGEVDVARSERERRGELAGERGARENKPSAHRRGDRFVGLDGARPARFGDVGLGATDRPRGLHRRASLGGEPERDARAVAARHDAPPGAPTLNQLLEERAEAPTFGDRLGQADDVEQKVMELVGVARIRLGLGDDAADRLFVEASDAIDDLGREPATNRHRAGAALLERRVVEERVRVGVEDLVREHARLGRLARVHRDGAGADRLDDGEGSFGVHPLDQAVAERLLDERMIRDLDLGADAVVVLTALLIGENGGEEIVGAHPEQRRRDLLAAGEAEERERARRVPAEARPEDRRLQRRLLEDLDEAFGSQELGHGVERKRVLGPEREEHAVVGRRGLELEVEVPTEPLAHEQAEGAVDPCAEGRVDDELHPARLVEEALGHNPRRRRHRAEGAARGLHVAQRELGAGPLERAVLDEPGDRRLLAFGVELGEDLFAQGGELAGELGRSRGTFAEPERHVRRLPVGVLDPDLAGLDALDAPGVVAEQEDVAGVRLDRVVLVERADLGRVGQQQDVVVGVVGDGAARGERGEARAAAALDGAVDAIAVEQRAGATAAGSDALGQHDDELVEGGALELLVRRSAAHEVEELVLAEGLGGAGGDHLLGEDVAGRVAELHRVEQAVARGADDRRALEELVARPREEAALRRRADRVAGAADPLHRRADGAR